MAFKPIEILINAKDNASAVFGSLQTKVVAVGAAIATYFGINAFVGVVDMAKTKRGGRFVISTQATLASKPL